MKRINWRHLSLLWLIVGALVFLICIFGLIGPRYEKIANPEYQPRPKAIERGRRKTEPPRIELPTTDKSANEPWRRKLAEEMQKEEALSKKKWYENWNPSVPQIKQTQKANESMPSPPVPEHIIITDRTNQWVLVGIMALIVGGAIITIMIIVPKSKKA